MRLVHYSRDPAFVPRPDAGLGLWIPGDADRLPAYEAGCHFYLEGQEDPWPGRFRSVWEAPEGTGRVAARYLADEGHEVVEAFVPAGQLSLLELVGRETTVRLPWNAVFAACRAAEEGEELRDG